MVQIPEDAEGETPPDIPTPEVPEDEMPGSRRIRVRDRQSEVYRMNGARIYCPHLQRPQEVAAPQTGSCLGFISTWIGKEASSFLCSDEDMQESPQVSQTKALPEEDRGEGETEKDCGARTEPRRAAEPSSAGAAER